MASYVIVPYRSVDGVEFGASPAQVRAHFGVPFESFKRSAEAPFPSDFFPSLGVFAYYSEDKLEAIEMTNPAEAIFESQNLSGLTVGALRDVLRRYEPCLDLDSDGLTAKAVGISAWAPFVKDDGLAARCESILAFSRGYYD